MRDLAVVDFETEPIDLLHYPPRPVGVAISLPGEGRRRDRRYYPFGHASGNTCSKAQVVERLRDVYENYDVAFHHAQFDLDVGETHLDGLWPKRKYHCTLVQAFLVTPYAPSLGLKEYYEERYGEPATERDDLRDWVLDHVPEAKRKKKE